MSKFFTEKDNYVNEYLVPACTARVPMYDCPMIVRFMPRALNEDNASQE